MISPVKKPSQLEAGRIALPVGVLCGLLAYIGWEFVVGEVGLGWQRLLSSVGIAFAVGIPVYWINKKYQRAKRAKEAGEYRQEQQKETQRQLAEMRAKQAKKPDVEEN